VDSNREPDTNNGGSRELVRRVVTVVAVTLGVLIFLLFLYVGVYVFLVVFAGLLLAVLLRTFSDWVVAATGLRHGVSLTIVILLLLILLVGFGSALAPQISDQIEELSEALPRSIQTIEEWLRQYEWGRILLAQVPAIEDVELEARTVGTVGAVFASVATMVAAVLFTLFIGLYVAAEPARYKRGLLHVVPLDRRERVSDVLDVMGHSVRWWLLGQLVSMTYLAITTTLLLWLLDVPLALILGLIVGLLTFIPYLGPILGFIPIILLVAVADPEKLFWVLPGYLLIQNSEGYFVTPMVQRKAVHLPPALTLGFELLLGITIGIFGFIMATPLLVVIMVAVQQLYIPWLGDRTFVEKIRERR
jgi:predicted PurR-regulated permease PerM